jgi:DNA primase
LYFQNTFKKLPESHPAKAYALARGLTAEIQEEFRIGYSTEEWDGLVKYLESKGFSLELAEEAKLIKARTGGKSGYFDLFRERLIFPILSTTGEPVGFGGRIIQKGEPKYLNSPDSMTFHKGKMLYGLYHTAKYIRAEDQVLIVEGYMDLISLFKNSIRHVVAPMGTALTADQAKILRRSTKNVIVLFDGDDAGQSAAERSLPILLAGDLHPKGLILPEGLDPDDYLKKYGADQLKDFLSKASDLFGVVLNQWMNGYRAEASQKVQLADRLRPIFEAIADQRLRQLYLGEAAQRMNVDPKWLMQAIAPTARKNTAMPFSPPAKSNPHAEVVPNTSENVSGSLISLKNISKVEQTLLSLCLKNRANLEVVLTEGLLPQLQSMGAKEVLERAASVYRQAPEKFDKLTSLLAGMVDKPEALFVDVSMTTQKSAEGFTAEDGEDGQLLKDCVIKIKDHHLQDQIKALMLELKGSSDPEKLKRLADLQKERLALRN